MIRLIHIRQRTSWLSVVLFSILFPVPGNTQTHTLVDSIQVSMKKATAFMMDSVSNEGGFVWYYLPDKSRRWGEMEAYPSMIWVQDGGTVGVGHTLLDAYQVTGDEFYYSAAVKTTLALLKGQSSHGGWNYMIDFAGEESIKKWYQTIGKNGWRLEEFQHYYGNVTYDDDVTSDAARFLMRIYFVKKDIRFKIALDKAINLICVSQYPNGGWPQRYPLKYDFQKKGHPDYSSFYTFNDEVIWENVNFLIQCYESLHDKQLLEPIKKGMYFFLLSQKPDGAWAQQYDHNMNVAGARTYEPPAFSTRTTFQNALTLLRFYQYTGDERFLKAVPKSIQWLEKTKLPESKREGGKYTHATNIDTLTHQPIYVHRKGSNVIYGYYYTDTADQPLLGHMSGKTNINLDLIKKEYERVKSIPYSEIKMKALFSDIQSGANYNSNNSLSVTNGDSFKFTTDKESIKRLINNQSNSGAWYVKNAMISHPYIGDGTLQDPTDKYASTNVGDSTDTSPYRDTTQQLYISTPAFINNMKMLLNFLDNYKKQSDASGFAQPREWIINNIAIVGGSHTEVNGAPIIKNDRAGKSVYFDGIDDGLLIPVNPIQSLNTFTINIWIKPTNEHSSAPRFFHTEDSEKNRVTMEMRTTNNGHWYLDTFLKNGKTNKGLTLIDSTLLHPVNKWYSVSLVYDGKVMRSYVNGKKEGEGEIEFPTMGSGKTSLGMRINKVNWFQGFISNLRFFPQPLDEKALFNMHMMMPFKNER